MMTAECPSCGVFIQLGGKPRIGQQVVCGACDSELEIVLLDPIELDWVYGDEDEDDDEDEYDDWEDFDDWEEFEDDDR